MVTIAADASPRLARDKRRAHFSELVHRRGDQGITAWPDFYAALADQPPKAVASPIEEVAEADLLRVERAKARLDLAQRDLDHVAAAVRAKYRLGADDAVDPLTRQIRRAHKSAKVTAK